MKSIFGPELRYAYSIRLMCILWKNGIYSFCSTYERKIK